MTIRQRSIATTVIGLSAFTLSSLLYGAFGKRLIDHGWNRDLVLFGTFIIVVGGALELFNRLIPAADCPRCGGRTYPGIGKRPPYVCRDCHAEISWEAQQQLKEAELDQLKFIGRWRQHGPLAGITVGVLILGIPGSSLAAARVLIYGGSIRSSAYIVASFCALGGLAGGIVGLRDWERSRLRLKNTNSNES